MDVKTTFRNLVRDQSVSICMLQYVGGAVSKGCWGCREGKARVLDPDPDAEV
jgi:hypothetical protein